MKINIARLIKCCFAFCGILLCSCSESGVESVNTDMTITSSFSESQETSVTTAKGSDINEKIPADTFTDEHSNAEVFSINAQVRNVSEYKELNIDGWNCNQINIEAFSGNDLFLTFSDDDILQIYKINTENSEKKFIGKCDWSVMYGFLSTVVDNRYFAIIPSKAAVDGLKSTLYVYDMQSNEFCEADSFTAQNMVQYLANIDENKAAYFYYEGATKDWVIRSYDFLEKESKEIYRNSDEDDKKFSPVGLAYNGMNLVMSAQYRNEKYITETKFIEIDMQGNVVRESITGDFPLAIGFFMYYDGKYYNVCGNRLRASPEFSTVIIDWSGNNFNTILPVSADLNVPTDSKNNRQFNAAIIRCNKNDYALIDTAEKSVEYFNIDVPGYTEIRSSASNENNDLALIKCDEGYNNAKLIVVKNSDICGN